VLKRDQLRAMHSAHQAMAALVAPPPRMWGSYGDGSWIVPPARIDGPEYIHVGAGVVIHEHVWLTAAAGPGPTPSLRIGDGASINRFVNIVCFESVTIGKDVLVADGAYISDVDYPAGRGGGEGAGLAAAGLDLVHPRPVVVGDGVFVGAGAIIKPGVTIGEFSYISAGSIVTEDVAERTLVAGAPARAMRRWDPAEGSPTDS